MSNPNPGAALIVAAFSLFGAFTTIAWNEDVKQGKASQLAPPEHVCHRLAYELDQQEVKKMITRTQRNLIVTHCWKSFS